LNNKEESRRLFSMLKGIILIDSLGNLDDYKVEIEKFCYYTGLPIIERKNVGLEGLKNVITKAILKAKNKAP
jgi:hypothetical protein